jgi:hypothetical protein
VTRAPLARLVAAATLVVAATVVLGPTAPASAASCTSADGVTVVVDPGALGGALTSVCDGGAGQAASARYADSGVALTYAQRQPGFVCRVDGAPASDPCVNTPPADAYWGLFWTDGTSGTWTYSSIGVTGLQVPEGGAVALAWQQGTTRRTPGIAAPVHKASPSKSPSPTKSPSKSPSTSPTRTPSPSPTTQSPATPSPTPTATPSAPTASAGTPSSRPSSQPSSTAPRSSAPASPARTPRAKRSGTSSATPSASPTDDASTSAPASAAPSADQSGPTADAAAGEEGRVPTWVTLAVLGVLLAVTATLAVAARRRRGDQP